MTLNVTVIRFERVLKGVGLPPPRSIVPAVLEKVGSVVQRVNADPVLPTPVTDSFVLSKVSFPSTALMLFDCGFTCIVAVNDCPTEYVPVLGDTATSAACVKRGKEKTNTKKQKRIFAIVCV
jgi:hypothetical protein